MKLKFTSKSGMHVRLLHKSAAKLQKENKVLEYLLHVNIRFSSLHYYKQRVYKRTETLNVSIYTELLYLDVQF